MNVVDADLFDVDSVDVDVDFMDVDMDFMDVDLLATTPAERHCGPNGRVPVREHGRGGHGAPSPRWARPSSRSPGRPPGCSSARCSWTSWIGGHCGLGGPPGARARDPERARALVAWGPPVRFREGGSWGQEGWTSEDPPPLPTCAVHRQRLRVIQSDENNV